jgi:hypothetical protein
LPTTTLGYPEQAQLPPELADLLSVLWQQIDTICGVGHEEDLWTCEGLASASEWQEIRRLAGMTHDRLKQMDVTPILD